MLFSYNISRGALVGDSPGVEPFHVLILLVASGHAPADGDEINVEADDDGIQDAIDGPLYHLCCLLNVKSTRKPKERIAK